MHVLSWYQKKTAHVNLCMAGGVAHNCSLNGKILYSGLFKNVFVHPASHDAGCALEAAFYLLQKSKPFTKSSPLQHVYLGTEVGDGDSIRNSLYSWNDFLSFEKVEKIVEQTTELLSSGAVVGWFKDVRDLVRGH